MGGLVTLVAIFIVFGLVLGTIAFVAYRRVLRRAKGVERGLKMVPLLIHLPPPSEDVENSGTRSEIDIIRSRVNEAQSLYDLLAGTVKAGFKSNFYGQRHLAFEIIANAGLVHYFAAVPIAMVSVVEQAIVTAYPGARLEEVEDHNIFNPQGHLTGTVGGELVLKHEAAYPIATIDKMEKDPMAALINALYKLQPGDGAAVQIMIRPAREKWTQRSIKLVAKKRHTRQGGLGFGVSDLAKAAVKTPEERREKAKTFEVSKLEEEVLQGIEQKTTHPGFEVLVRVLASSPTYDRSRMLLQSLTTSFALFEAPGSNGFQFIEGRDMQGLVTAFIFRFFPPELTGTVLNSVELATLFHLPDAQFTPTTQVERQQSKQVDGPVNMPAGGLLLGYNFYRGVKKEIRLSEQDRRRHTYIVGQTGTGKSTILENMAVQDMLAGNGFAFIDPHGDTAEKLISMVPKERAEDVIYFNPGDMERPLGLNLFEFNDPTQKDFLIQESINMLYKLYDPGHTGIIGPRFEHWFRNAALTLMADPDGASFIEIPKVFTDSAYLKNKFKYLTDPTVIDFWTKEMGQTSDYHKSEMLGFFVSKFGAFQSNEMMRNIIGQTRSAFNLREIMDGKKILIVNLGKGRVGELNAQLLGMMFVMKFQAAAMSRATVPEDQRPDFSLYVDEFQNFSTDSFASILSEARKYRLNLIVANQFIGQLTDEIRDAVFGNVGTMMSYRCGPEDAEFLVKEFQPIFDQRDLVNLPNYNAVMKLLIGGLPSQPFSITALPPLGQAHAEMGLAVKQLSAAKYGIPRQTVEADIFARLQNQRRVVAPPAAPAASLPPAQSPGTQPAPAVPVVAPPPPVPVQAPPTAAPAQPQAAPAQPAPQPAPPPPPPVPAVQTPPVPAPAPSVPLAAATNVSALLPAAKTSTAPVSQTSAATPSAAPDRLTEAVSSAPPPPPVTAIPPAPQAASVAAPVPVPPPTPAPAPEPAEPPPPSAPDELSLAQLSSSMPKPVTPAPKPVASVVPAPEPQPAPAPPPSVSKPAPAAPRTAEPVNSTSPAAPAPVKLALTNPPIPASRRIEAHETDGRRSTAPQLQLTKPLSLPAPPPEKLIEAEEHDGITAPSAGAPAAVAASSATAALPAPAPSTLPVPPAPPVLKDKLPVQPPASQPPKPPQAVRPAQPSVSQTQKTPQPAQPAPKPQSPGATVPKPQPAPTVPAQSQSKPQPKPAPRPAPTPVPRPAPKAATSQPPVSAPAGSKTPKPAVAAVVPAVAPQPSVPPVPALTPKPAVTPQPQSAPQPVSVEPPAPQPTPKLVEPTQKKPSPAPKSPPKPQSAPQPKPAVNATRPVPPPKPAPPSKPAPAPRPAPSPVPEPAPISKQTYDDLRTQARETLEQLAALEPTQSPSSPSSTDSSTSQPDPATPRIVRDDQPFPIEGLQDGSQAPSDQSAPSSEEGITMSHSSKVIAPLEDIPLPPAKRQEFEEAGIHLDAETEAVAAPSYVAAAVPKPVPKPAPPILAADPAPTPPQPGPVIVPAPASTPAPIPVLPAPPPVAQTLPVKPEVRPAASEPVRAPSKPHPKPQPTSELRPQPVTVTSSVTPPPKASKPQPPTSSPKPPKAKIEPSTSKPKKIEPPRPPKESKASKPVVNQPTPPQISAPVVVPPPKEVAKPVDNTPPPAPVPAPKPEPEPEATPDAANAEPNLQPGEIFVDAQGNVVQG